MILVLGTIQTTTQGWSDRREEVRELLESDFRIGMVATQPPEPAPEPDPTRDSPAVPLEPNVQVSAVQPDTCPPPQRYGRIDILVSNAAVNPGVGPILNTPEDQIEKILDINIKAAIFLAKVKKSARWPDGVAVSQWVLSTANPE